MQALSQKIMVGTSGFYYEHWRGVLYPDDLPKSRFFAYYMRHFPTVELNNTFYHLPKAKTVTHWMEESPEDFLFALKAHREITHYRRLRDADDALYRFLHLIKPMRPRLAAILLQLPPSLHADPDLLAGFLPRLPSGYHYTIEFRDPGWYDEQIYTILKSYNVALCLHDFARRTITPVITADFGYLRLHGPDGRYGGSYSDARLKEIADILLQMAHHLKHIFVYFNNDTDGYAVQNARTLTTLLQQTSS